jgi:hypothetical protein
LTLWHQLTDAQRERLVEEIVAAIVRSDIPFCLHDGLVRYFSDGILPGGFMQAVLCNNLRHAVLRADPVSFFCLRDLVDFLVEHAPAPAWGSREAVLAWTTTPDRLEI